MNFSVYRRRIIAASHDAVMAALSFFICVYLRLGEQQIGLASDFLLQGVLLFTGICVAVFTLMGLYRGLWRFASMQDMLTIGKAVSLAVAVFAVAMFMLNRLEFMPRSVLVMNWLVLMWLLAAPRFAYRALKDRTLFWEMTLEEKAKIPVMLVGATNLAEQFIQDMSRDVRTPYRVVGILDDSRSRQGCMMHRVPILGGVEDLPRVLSDLARQGSAPHKLLIADARFSGEVIGRLMTLADAAAIPVARIPRLRDVHGHFDAQTQVQPVALEDLLGRPQAALDRAAMRALIEGRRVLVTGAGGSIGGELCRQMMRYRPHTLVLLDHSEFALYEIGREMEGASVVRVLGDVRDVALMEQLMTVHRPDIVFHAAAIKHVPIAQHNPEETILTNIIGSAVVADACIAHRVGMMVLISTDKAVNPSSVMGASKKLAEMVCQSKARHADGVTRFVTVRFGNVLGSTGSVVPLFHEQIKKGGPVTVTHPEMTRYFMTIREAVELVMQAAAIGATLPQKQAPILVLDMGSPVNILSLAHQMIRLAGRRVGEEDIPIVVTGIREGEKMHEELFAPDEHSQPTSHPSILLAVSASSVRQTDDTDFLARLQRACLTRNRQESLALLREYVPYIQPIYPVV